MSTVHPVLHARVVARIRECMRKIHDQYGVIYREPTIDYTLTGTIAGWANFNDWHINLNAGLLKEHTDAFIQRTVPHEFAHLVTSRLYPETTRYSSAIKDAETGQVLVPAKRAEPHGEKWQEVMAVLGVESSRTHKYDTSNTAKPKSKYEYYCPNCKKSIFVGPNIHHTQQRQGKKRYYCTACAVAGKPETIHHIVLKQALGRVTYNQAQEIASGNREVGPDAKFKLKLKAPTGKSKYAQCWTWFTNYYEGRGYTRSDIISIFVQECGCTEAGAATYYANCKKLYEAGIA